MQVKPYQIFRGSYGRQKKIRVCEIVEFVGDHEAREKDGTLLDLRRSNDLGYSVCFLTDEQAAAMNALIKDIHSSNAFYLNYIYTTPLVTRESWEKLMQHKWTTEEILEREG